MVIFVTAISEYDQALKEDPTVNRLHESLKLFKSICNNKWFQNTAMMLFLNKEDVFGEKLKYSPMKSCFSHYTGSQDKIEATTFLANEFSKCKETKRLVYTHLTRAKDPDSIGSAFDVVAENILLSNLKGMVFE